MMSVTGVLLTYEAQLNRWALREYHVQPPDGASPLDLDTLVARATADLQGAPPRAVVVEADPVVPIVVRFDEGERHVDRYHGEIRGDGVTPMWRILRATMYMHRWFALEGNVRIVGRTFTATANLGFLFLILSGAYLWWPRGGSTWRYALWYRRALAGRARDFNWHSVTGFWTAVPLVVIVASGATMSYRWAGDLVFRVAGETPPNGPAIAAASPVMFDDVPRAADAGGETVPLETVLAQAAARGTDWQRIVFSLPEDMAAPVAVTIDRGSGRQPALTEDVLYDRFTGAVVGAGGYPTYSRGLKMRRWLRFAHTGEVYGVVGQTIAGAVSLATVLLVWTGVAMSWRRFVRPRGR